MQTKNEIKIELPKDIDLLPKLRAGDCVKLTSVIYTARDAAHKRMCEMLKNGNSLGFELKGSIIYYCGPCPEKPGSVIGSCGPTTSGRMDEYAPYLIQNGLIATIGKGKRNKKVKEAMLECGALYFAAVGGAAALMASCVKEKTLVDFADLGCEAVYKLRVEDMPLVVVCDSIGGDLYEIRSKNERN